MNLPPLRGSRSDPPSRFERLVYKAPRLCRGILTAAPRGIVALCDSLVVMGFLTKLSGRYALSPDALSFLDRRSPMCIAGIHDFLAAPEMVALIFQDPAGAVRRGGAPGLANVAPDFARRFR